MAYFLITGIFTAAVFLFGAHLGGELEVSNYQSLLEKYPDAAKGACIKLGPKHGGCDAFFKLQKENIHE